MKLRFGLVAAIFLAVFTLYPQLKLHYLREPDWSGHYAYNDIDEVAYASYLRALIDGRPRKSDPYSGRDDTVEEPQPESLFSIQFAAPYAVAIPARAFGVGVPWAMTVSGALAGFLAAFVTFWLIAQITGNSWYGMAGSLVVFAGGALAAGEGAVLEVFFDGFSYPYFPGFRRYLPAMAMPAVFAMFGLVWKLMSPPKGLSRATSRRWFTIATCLGVVACFAFTVFSYFYIWTTAAAWLAALALIWVLFRPPGFKRDLMALVGVGVGCGLVLIPYAYLLSKRAESLDHVQLLVHTRKPDIWRMPEFIGLVCLFLIVAAAANRVISLRERGPLFALSFAIVPVIILNQQVITGRSLQPIHYQVFIGNYVAGLAVVLTLGCLLHKSLSGVKTPAKLGCAALTVVAIAWGFVECHFTVRVLDGANVARDEAFPVAKRLEALAKSHAEPHKTTVLAFDMIQADDLPSVAPQNVLWARHQHIFVGLSWAESKERYYQYLYYSNVDEEALDWLLKNDFVSQIALFGWGRHSDRLSVHARPLTYGEIAEEVHRYAAYIAHFGPAEASEPELSYVVLNDEMNSDLTNLDRWYERYDGESIGKYTLYRVKRRPD